MYGNTLSGQGNPRPDSANYRSSLDIPAPPPLVNYGQQQQQPQKQQQPAMSQFVPSSYPSSIPASTYVQTSIAHHQNYAQPMPAHQPTSVYGQPRPSQPPPYNPSMPLIRSQLNQKISHQNTPQSSSWIQQLSMIRQNKPRNPQQFPNQRVSIGQPSNHAVPSGNYRPVEPQFGAGNANNRISSPFNSTSGIQHHNVLNSLQSPTGNTPVFSGFQAEIPNRFRMPAPASHQQANPLPAHQQRPSSLMSQNRIYQERPSSQPSYANPPMTNFNVTSTFQNYSLQSGLQGQNNATPAQGVGQVVSSVRPSVSAQSASIIGQMLRLQHTQQQQKMLQQRSSVQQRQAAPHMKPTQQAPTPPLQNVIGNQKDPGLEAVIKNLIAEPEQLSNHANVMKAIRIIHMFHTNPMALQRHGITERTVILIKELMKKYQNKSSRTSTNVPLASAYPRAKSTPQQFVPSHSNLPHTASSQSAMTSASFLSKIDQSLQHPSSAQTSQSGPAQSTPDDVAAMIQSAFVLPQSSNVVASQQPRWYAPPTSTTVDTEQHPAPRTFSPHSISDIMKSPERTSSSSPTSVVSSASLPSSTTSSTSSLQSSSSMQSTSAILSMPTENELCGLPRNQTGTEATPSVEPVVTDSGAATNEHESEQRLMDVESMFDFNKRRAINELVLDSQFSSQDMESDFDIRSFLPSIEAPTNLLPPISPPTNEIQPNRSNGNNLQTDTTVSNQTEIDIKPSVLQLSATLNQEKHPSDQQRKEDQSLCPDSEQSNKGRSESFCSDIEIRDFTASSDYVSDVPVDNISSSKDIPSETVPTPISEQQPTQCDDSIPMDTTEAMPADNSAEIAITLKSEPELLNDNSKSPVASRSDNSPAISTGSRSGEKRKLESAMDDSPTSLYSPPVKLARGRGSGRGFSRGRARGRGAESKSSRGKWAVKLNDFSSKPTTVSGRKPTARMSRGRGKGRGGRGRGRGNKQNTTQVENKDTDRATTITKLDKSVIEKPNALKAYIDTLDREALESCKIPLSTVKAMLESCFPTKETSVERDTDDANEDKSNKPTVDDDSEGGSSSGLNKDDSNEALKINQVLKSPERTVIEVQNALNTPDKTLTQVGKVTKSPMKTVIKVENANKSVKKTITTEVEKDVKSQKKISEPDCVSKGNKDLGADSKASHDSSEINKSNDTEFDHKSRQNSVKRMMRKDSGDSSSQSSVPDDSKLETGNLRSSLKDNELTNAMKYVSSEPYALTKDHKIQWVRFHGKIVTRLIAPDGNYFILKEIIRRCFRIKEPNKSQQYKKIRTIKNEVLKIPDIKMDSVFFHIAVQNLKSRNIIKTVPDYFVVISEDNTNRLFHHVCKEKYCTDGCITPYIKSVRKRVASRESTEKTKVQDNKDRNLFDILQDDSKMNKSGGSAKSGKIIDEVIDLCADSSDGYESDQTCPYVDGEPENDDRAQIIEEVNKLDKHVTNDQTKCADRARKNSGSSLISQCSQKSTKTSTNLSKMDNEKDNCSNKSAYDKSEDNGSTNEIEKHTPDNLPMETDSVQTEDNVQVCSADSTVEKSKCVRTEKGLNKPTDENSQSGKEVGQLTSDNDKTPSTDILKISDVINNDSDTIDITNDDDDDDDDEDDDVIINGWTFPGPPKTYPEEGCSEKLSEAQDTLRKITDQAMNAKSSSELADIYDKVVSITKPLKRWTYTLLDNYEEALHIEAQKIKLMELSKRADLTETVNIDDDDEPSPPSIDSTIT